MKILRKLFVSQSTSIREVLTHFGLRAAGGNYHAIKRKIMELKIDCSHFTGRGHLKGKTHNWAKKTPTEQILVNNSTWGGNSDSLRKRLIKENYFDEKCHCCNKTEWLGQPISLELEHINGNRFDNRIENLTILCPNCHAQTPTYRGRKNKGKTKETENKTEVCVCKECGKQISKRSAGLCKKCASVKRGLSQRKVKRPEKEQLLQDVKELGYSATGRKYGVSDNAIRKWLRLYA